MCKKIVVFLLKIDKVLSAMLQSKTASNSWDVVQFAVLIVFVALKVYQKVYIAFDELHSCIISSNSIISMTAVLLACLFVFPLASFCLRVLK